MSELVTYEVSESIATITINRADRLNALNEGVIVGLQQAWQCFEAGDEHLRLSTARRNLGDGLAELDRFLHSNF